MMMMMMMLRLYQQDVLASAPTKFSLMHLNRHIYTQK